MTVGIFLSMPKSPAVDTTMKVCRAVIDPVTGEVKKECQTVDTTPAPCGCFKQAE